MDFKYFLMIFFVKNRAKILYKNTKNKNPNILLVCMFNNIFVNKIIKPSVVKIQRNL